MIQELPAQFWKDLLASNRGKTDIRKSSLDRRAQKEWVLGYLKKNHPKLFSGIDGAVFSENDIKNYLNDSRGRVITQDFVVRLKFLIQGLEKGKSLYKWERVLVPVAPIKANREPARFSPEDFRCLNAIRPLHSSFCNFLEKPLSDQPSGAIGYILLSAVLYGGLLDRRWLTPLLRGLPDRVSIHGDIMWMDLQLPYIYTKDSKKPEKTKYINRRWFPDPLTQALIIRIRKKHPNILELCHHLDANFCLKFVIHQLIPDATLRPSISELFKGAITWLGLRLPSFIVSFAAGKTTSVSLAPHVWTRLLTDMPVLSPQEVQEEKPTDDLPAQRYGIVETMVPDMCKQEILRKELAEWF